MLHSDNSPVNCILSELQSALNIYNVVLFLPHIIYGLSYVLGLVLSETHPILKGRDVHLGPFGDHIFKLVWLLDFAP